MHQSVRLKPDDPVYPCDAVDETVQEGLLPDADVLHPPAVYDYDYKKGFETCDGIDAEYV